MCQSQNGQVCNINGISSTCKPNEGCGLCKVGYIGKKCEHCQTGFLVTQGNNLTGLVDPNGNGVYCVEGNVCKILLISGQCGD